MKNKAKTISTLLSILIIAVASILPASAAENLKINSVADVAVGDTFTYSFYIDKCDVSISGLQMFIYFSPDKLELVTESIEHEALDDTAIDVTKNENYYKLLWGGGLDEIKVDGRKSLVSLEFKVLSGGETDIEYFVEELYNCASIEDDPKEIDSYEFTFDISKGEKKLAEKIVPKVLSDQSVLDELQGSFINYKDGKGENNLGESVTGPDASEIKHEPVTGAGKTSPVNSNTQPSSDTSIFIYIAAGVIIVAVVGVVFVKIKNGKNNSETEEESNYDEEIE